MATRKKADRSEHTKPSSQPPLTINGYFTSLTIENVRCFGAEPQELRLCDVAGWPSQWTVVLGNNGTGKTTLLQCLAGFDPVQAADAPSGVKLRGRVDLDSGWAPLKRLGERRNWRIMATVADLPSLQKQDKPFPQCKVAIECEDSQVSYRLAPGATVKKYKVDVECEGSQGKRNRSGAGGDPSLCVCYGYGANRRMGPRSPSQMSLAEFPANDGTATLFDDDAELRNAEEWLLQADYAASKKSEIQGQLRRHRDQVMEILKRILPEVHDVRVSPPTKQRPRPTIEFETPDGWIPLQSIGYGYRTFVAWIVDLASRMMQRYPDADDPLARPAVVLVDEIDLHLHPTWQRKLMSYLGERFPNTQFVVTAHSPIFVHAASGANVVLLRREEAKGYVVIENSPEMICNWRIDQLLTSDLFGLSSVRPPEIEPLLVERRKILSKKTLTKRDQRRLRQLETRIGPLPTGETVDDIKKAERLDRTLELLEKRLES